MKMLLLLIYIFGVSGTCEEGDEYIYSDNNIQSQRCSDNAYFFATSKYINRTYCSNSDSLDKFTCWWDTTVKPHCLKSEECVWLDDKPPGGSCYCAESKSCDACNGHEPTPTGLTPSFECPVGCKVYYQGCVGMYCNCFGGCGAAEELRCSNPVNPQCHIWYAPEKPVHTIARTLYWGVRLCCFAETFITSTPAFIEAALGLYDVQVSVLSYKPVIGERRRESVLDGDWEIIYEIKLEDSKKLGDLMTSLKDSRVHLIEEQINANLEIQLHIIRTTSLSEIEPVDILTPESGLYTQMVLGGIIGGLITAFLAGFMCHCWCVWKSRRSAYNFSRLENTEEGELVKHDHTYDI